MMNILFYTFSPLKSNKFNAKIVKILWRTMMAPEVKRIKLLWTTYIVIKILFEKRHSLFISSWFLETKQRMRRRTHQHIYIVWSLRFLWENRTIYLEWFMAMMMIDSTSRSNLIFSNRFWCSSLAFQRLKIFNRL